MAIDATSYYLHFIEKESDTLTMQNQTFLRKPLLWKKNHFGKKSSLSKVRHEVEVLCCVCSIHEIVCRSNVLVKHVPLYSGKRRIKYCNLLSNYGTWIVIEFKFWPEAGKKKYVDFKTRSILLVLLYEYES